MKAGLLIYSSR